MAVAGNIVKEGGIFGFDYNRQNFKFDIGLRWQRFTVGRQMEIKRFGMFREDVSDLAGVPVAKLKLYTPIMTMTMGYVMTILVEGRSGLKFPGPPTVASGLYLQCLGVAFALLTYGVWLTFHSSLRAQVAMTQLRTRIVRLPVPTQRQLDDARKLLSSYEEQSVYDMFRLPFVMPNTGNTPPGSDDEGGKSKDKGGYSKGGLPGVAAKVKGKVKELDRGSGGSKKELVKGLRMPGVTSGAPSWIEKEFDQRDANPKASPSAFGIEAPPEPYEHFELLRKAQKEYWCAEAYARVCFLFGSMHITQAFGYWCVLHIAMELLLIWCSIAVAGAFTAGVWFMFRLDILPDHGGLLPFEAGGPFMLSISLALAYTLDHNQATTDISRATGILCIFMQLMWTLRLYMVALPSGDEPSYEAKESGGRLFNQTAACEAPSWLPSAFQPVMYMVSPPKTKAQLAQEKLDRENPAVKGDPLIDVDMVPWYGTRIILFVAFIGWLVLLAGRIVECIQGERMLVTNPGSPPWSRVGLWNGWESGPISSKHYAHVTPQRGHFAWSKGWGPQGQQELWASDMFGFHPEADAHWAESEGPAPLVGAAGIGENTWAKGLLKYGENENDYGNHDWEDSNGHRRLHAVVPGVVMPVVPSAVQWPSLLEPQLLACGAKDGQVAAFTTGGMGAFIPAHVASGVGQGTATSFTLDGLLGLGMAHSISWGRSGLLVATGSGHLAECPMVLPGASAACSAMDVPKLPMPRGTSRLLTAVVEATAGEPLRAAVAAPGSRVLLHELSDDDWQFTGEVSVPFTAEGETEAPEIVSVSMSHGHLLVATADGSAFTWQLQRGTVISRPTREAPSAGPRRNWLAACKLPTGKVVRLASNWRKSNGGVNEWKPELLI
jgi:hypothetical protein